MFAMKKGVAALSLLALLAIAGSASAQTTRTWSLTQGDMTTPVTPVIDLSGMPTYYGGFVVGQLDGATPGTFTLGLTFRSTGFFDPTTGIYSGYILAPNSSFSVSEVSGRKSVSTSGTIDNGAVTYRLLPDGRAEVVSVVTNGLTVWEGKNRTRRAVAHGSLDYGTATEGAGTMVLYY